MSLKSTCLAAALAAFPALVTFSATAQMAVEDPYARASSPAAISGAAFMQIMNPTDQDDRVIGVRTEIAERAELHTHLQADNGMMQMVHVEEGFAIPAGGMIHLERGGMHVMFLGLRQPLAQGDTVEITLEFEHAAPLTVTVPVDLERQPGAGGMDHSGHAGHGNDS